MAKITDAVTLVSGRTGELQEQTLFLRRSMFGSWWFAKCIQGQTVLIHKGPSKVRTAKYLNKHIQVLERNGWSLVDGKVSDYAKRGR